jgi:uncharacterized protein (TIGR02246 family)
VQQIQRFLLFGSLGKEGNMRFARFSVSFGLVILGLLVSTACQKKAGFDLGQARQAIAEENTRFTEAVRQGDATAMAALYTEDATLLPPDSNMVTGKSAVETFWQGGLTAGIKDIILTTVSVSGGGNLAYEIGTFVLKIQTEGQEPVEQKGKYVVVWQKTAAGEWKLHVDIWNNNPLP